MIRLAAILALSVLVAVPTRARAQRRTFVQAYTYDSEPAGRADIEAWSDIDTTAEGPTDPSEAIRIEADYGITDHLTLALIQHIGLDNPGIIPPELDGWGLRAGYRFGAAGLWPVDVKLQLWAVYYSGDAQRHGGVGARLVLERDVGRLSVVVDVSTMAEPSFTQLDPYHPSRYTLVADYWRSDLDVAACFRPSPAVRMGIEGLFTSIAAGDPFVWHHDLLVGPSISLSAGRTWLQIGVLLRAGLPADRFLFRSVLGVHL